MSDQSEKKKRSYLRTASVVLGIALVAGLGVQGIAKVNGLSIKDNPYVIFLSYQTPFITRADLEQQKIKPAIFVDVRTPDEYKQDHIGNSVSIPHYEIEDGSGIQKLEKLVKASSQANQPEPTVVLYCAAGPRSIKAYHKLKESGSRLNLVVLKGGEREWRHAISPNQDMKILAPIMASPNGNANHPPSHTVTSKQP